VNIVPAKYPSTGHYSHIVSVKKSEAEGFIYLIFYFIAVTSK
jgi:hypothetical protein